LEFFVLLMLLELLMLMLMLLVLLMLMLLVLLHLMFNLAQLWGNKHSMSLVVGVSWFASQAANAPTNITTVGTGSIDALPQT